MNEWLVMGNNKRNLMKELAKSLHGEPLTNEERDAHEEAGESFHVPVILHRTGGVSALLLNTCGICGAQIVPGRPPASAWIKISEEQADEIRKRE